MINYLNPLTAEQPNTAMASYAFLPDKGLNGRNLQMKSIVISETEFKSKLSTKYIVHLLTFQISRLKWPFLYSLIRSRSYQDKAVNPLATETPDGAPSYLSGQG